MSLNSKRLEKSSATLLYINGCCCLVLLLVLLRQQQPTLANTLDSDNNNNNNNNIDSLLAPPPHPQSLHLHQRQHRHRQQQQHQHQRQQQRQQTSKADLDYSSNNDEDYYEYNNSANSNSNNFNNNNNNNNNFKINLDRSSSSNNNDNDADGDDNDDNDNSINDNGISDDWSTGDSDGEELVVKKGGAFMSSAISKSSGAGAPVQSGNTVVELLSESIIEQTCKLDRGCLRRDHLNNTYLGHCRRYKLEYLFSSSILMAIMHGDQAKCQMILREFMQLDETIKQFDQLFKNLLTRYNCHNGYSVKWTCQDCKKAYKDWLCAINLPYYMHGEQVKPCISFCERVEQRCPYLHPITREQYGGQAVFICRDPNIPFVPSITPSIPYSEPTRCYELCHLSDNETELINDSLSKYAYNDCPHRDSIAEEVRSDPFYNSCQWSPMDTDQQQQQQQQLQLQLQQQQQLNHLPSLAGDAATSGTGGNNHQLAHEHTELTGLLSTSGGAIATTGLYGSRSPVTTTTRSPLNHDDDDLDLNLAPPSRPSSTPHVSGPNSATGASNGLRPSSGAADADDDVVNSAVAIAPTTTTQSMGDHFKLSQGTTSETTVTGASKGTTATTTTTTSTANNYYNNRSFATSANHDDRYDDDTSSPPLAGVTQLTTMDAPQHQRHQINDGDSFAHSDHHHQQQQQQQQQHHQLKYYQHVHNKTLAELREILHQYKNQPKHRPGSHLHHLHQGDYS